MQTIVGEELKQPMGAAILSPQPSSQPVLHKELLLTKHVRAVPLMKRACPPARDLVDLSDHRHRRLVARAHLQHLPHFVSQLCLTLRDRLHVRIPPLALQSLPPRDAKTKELDAFLSRVHQSGFLFVEF